MTWPLPRQIFEAHTATAEFDEETSGAEWWVQMRGQQDEQCAPGIGFHWDKDEDLLDSCGITLCPQISTVTYLTDAGNSRH